MLCFKERDPGAIHSQNNVYPKWLAKIKCRCLAGRGWETALVWSAFPTERWMKWAVTRPLSTRLLRAGSGRGAP